MIRLDGTGFLLATQTISEAQAQGYTHLRATCPCGRIADLHRNTFPWKHSAPVPEVREHRTADWGNEADGRKGYF